MAERVHEGLLPALAPDDCNNHKTGPQQRHPAFDAQISLIPSPPGGRREAKANRYRFRRTARFAAGAAATYQSGLAKCAFRCSTNAVTLDGTIFGDGNTA